MAKPNRKKKEEEPKQESRKEQRLRRRDRERNRKVTLIVGGALAVALVFVLIGTINELLIKPRSVLARVEGQPIVTQEFWDQTRLRKSELEEQLAQLEFFSAQFGGQDFFGSQIAQLRATLNSPLSLGTQVINEMIEDRVIRLRADELGVSVSDAEVEEFLREEVAARQNALTVPQATATAEAQANATATAASFTPTPAPTQPAAEEGEESEGDEPEEAAEESLGLDTPESDPFAPTPRPVLDDNIYQLGLQERADQLRPLGISLDEYREVIRARLLRDKMVEAIGSQEVEATEEQVLVRHILIRVDEDLTGLQSIPEIVIGGEDDEALTADEAAEDVAEDVAEEAAGEAAEEATAAPQAEAETTAETTAESEATATPAPESETDAETDAETEAETAAESAAEEATATPAAEEEASPEATATTAPEEEAEAETASEEADLSAETEAEADADLFEFDTDDFFAFEEQFLSDEEALALITELRQRILDGESFADLAQEYSDDTGSGLNGGLLDWAGRGQYVIEFEEAAFSLPVGELSEPVRTQFGYHLLLVEDRDNERPKDENQLRNEWRQVFELWLSQQVLEADIQRPQNLPARLPSGL